MVENGLKKKSSKFCGEIEKINFFGEIEEILGIFCIAITVQTSNKCNSLFVLMVFDGWFLISFGDVNIGL